MIVRVRALSIAARAVPLADIKALRALTGAPIQSVRSALVAHDGDLDAAAAALRREGMALSAKRAAERGTNEGVVGVGVSECGSIGALVAVGCETDFVARTERFRELATLLVGEALSGSEDVMGHDAVGSAAAALREAIAVRGLRVIRAPCVAGYAHGTIGVDGVGHIGALAGLEAGDTEDIDKLKSAARRVAMHIAASAPVALRREDLSSDEVERERKALEEAALESGKPVSVVERIVEGKLGKWFADVCLLDQEMVAEVSGYNGKGRSVAKSVAAECQVGKVVDFARLSIH